MASLLSRGVRKRHVVLLGFSQGGCLAGEYAVRHADRYGGVIMLSGGLIGPPGTVWRDGGDFAATPVFLGCSDVDGHIPKERVLESGDGIQAHGGRRDACGCIPAWAIRSTRTRSSTRAR